MLLDEGVFQSILQRHSLERVCGKQSADETFGKRAHCVWVANLSVCVSSHKIHVVVSHKWQSSSEEFEHQDTYAPIVCVDTVVVALCHLRRDVVQSATECLSHVGLSRKLNGPTEVCQFELAVEPE